jgi:hypothetical protein
MRQPLAVILIPTVFLISPHRGNAESFTKEEQALIKKNMTMEMYKPDEHSRHFVANISATDPRTDKERAVPTKSQPVLCFVFGMEDAQPAREQGRSMVECKYTPQQAHEFLFAQGWDKYHDRFFTRCYVQEGEAAYQKEAKAQQKPVDQSQLRSSSTDRTSNVYGNAVKEAVTLLFSESSSRTKNDPLFG